MTQNGSDMMAWCRARHKDVLEKLSTDERVDAEALLAHEARVLCCLPPTPDVPIKMDFKTDQVFRGMTGIFDRLRLKYDPDEVNRTVHMRVSEFEKTAPVFQQKIAHFIVR